MGLDMYLYARNKETKEDVEVAYWRKANQVLKFFKECFGEMKNCKEYNVSIDTIKGLLKTCENVLNKATDGENVTNVKYAHQMLPTQDGFFFGSTEYDKWYVRELQSTVDKLKVVVEQFNPEVENLVFMAWW